MITRTYGGNCPHDIASFHTEEIETSETILQIIPEIGPVVVSLLDSKIATPTGAPTILMVKDIFTLPIILLIISFITAKTLDGATVLASVTREIHLVQKLSAKLFIGNDILGPESFTINVKKKIAHIASCNVSIELNIRPRGSYLRRKVRRSQALILQPGEKQTIAVTMNLPKNRDFMFQPIKHANFTFFSHVVECNMIQILVKNDSLQPVQIPRKYRVGDVSEFNYENCYQISNPKLTMRPANDTPKIWFKKAFTAAAMLSTISQSQPIKPKTPGPSPQDILSKIPSQNETTVLPHVPDHKFPSIQVTIPNDPSRCETCLPNGISLYGNKDEIGQYTQLVDEFPTLWVNDGFIDVPKDQWMTIPLKQNWKSKISGKSKIYPLGRDDRAVIDSIFDKMHEQGRLIYRNGLTPVSFPVFVVWRTVNGERKGRPVIDIRGFNELTVPDAYPIFLQKEVISDLRNYTHISVLDANSFFYQWRVHSKDTYNSL